MRPQSTKRTAVAVVAYACAPLFLGYYALGKRFSQGKEAVSMLE